MLIQTITVNENAPQIMIGRRGEYNAEQVIFDMSQLAETYGAGTATLMVKRPGDTAAYPAVTEQTDNLLTWTISAVDTSYKGAAECELFWTVGEALAKSVVYPVLVLRDIGDAGATPPDPYTPWIDNLVETVEASERAAAASAAEAEAVLGSIPEDYSDLSDTVDSIFYQAIPLTLNAGYINANGTIASQSASNVEIYTDYIAVTPGEKYTITLTNPAGKSIWLAVGRRTSGGSWVSRSVLINLSTTSGLVEYTYTVPSGTGRISFTYRSYGSITSSLKLEKYLFYTAAQGAALDTRVTALENGGAKKNAVRPKNKVYSTNHRGWHQCPENTLAAYRQSAAHGFPQVETDIRFTSDNVPVLLHDATINRTARNPDGTSISGDVAISSITYAQALEYDFGIYKGSAYAGEKIPSLADFLKLCRDLGLIPYLEIEGTLSAEKTGIIAQVVEASGIRNDVVFISNYPRSLTSLLPYFPANRFGVSPWTYSDDSRLDAISLFNNTAEIFMHMSYSQVTSTIIGNLQADNIPLEIWVVDSAAILAADPYVSGFTSNDAVASTVLYNQAISG